MTRVASLALLVGCCLVGTAAEKVPATFYVQLIRGTDESQPPEPGCKRVGPKLAEHFHAVFRMKHYWEMNRKEVQVVAGKTARVPLSAEKEVEIDLSDPEKRKVTVWQNQRVVDRTVRPAGEAMTLIGGNRDRESIWFVVVRRDRPSSQ